MKDARNDKLPRGHTYIHMRNRGYAIDIDYLEIDSLQAEHMIKAVLAIMNEEDAAAGLERSLDKSDTVIPQQQMGKGLHEQ